MKRFKHVPEKMNEIVLKMYFDAKDMGEMEDLEEELYGLYNAVELEECDYPLYYNFVLWDTHNDEKILEFHKLKRDFSALCHTMI